MKYETPEMTTLRPAIKAIQTTSAKDPVLGYDSFNSGDPFKEAIGAYVDWE